MLIELLRFAAYGVITLALTIAGAKAIIDHLYKAKMRSLGILAKAAGEAIERVENKHSNEGT